MTLFHVRNSSEDDAIDLNKQLIIYVFHGTSLFSWTRLLHHHDKGNLGNFQQIGSNISNYQFVSEDCFMFLETTTINVKGEEIEHSVIKIVESECMDF